jgi:hypothetical protein
MKNKTLKLWTRACAALGLALLAGTNAHAQPTVATLGGGSPLVTPKYQGYRNGATLTHALFRTPAGLALDSTGQYLYVADRDNNAIRYLDLTAGQTWTFGVTFTNLINKPIAVAVDSSDYVYVLNRGNGTSGSVITFDNWGDAVVTNAVGLSTAAGLALDTVGNIYVTIQGNKLIRIAAGTTNRTTIATIPNAGTSLQGIVVKHNGLIAACDSGRNGIYLINPATGVVTTNAGFHGTGDFTTNGNNIASSTTAKFNQPMCVAEAGDGTLIVTDYGNNRVKAVLASGVVTNLYGVTSQYWGGSYPGWYDGAVKVPDSIAPNVQSRLPFGVVMASDGSFYTSEDFYHIIRKVTGTGLTPPPPPPPTAPTILTVTTNYGQVTLTWSAVTGATSYNVKRSPSSGGPYATIVSTTATSYTDTNVMNGTTYYYVVSASNAGGEGPNSAEVSATPPIPPPPAPRIGWFDYEGNNQTGFFTVLHPVSGANWFTAHNDLLIAVDPTTNGLATYYITTNGPQPVLAVPSSTNGGTPPFYQDGLAFAQPLPVTTVPDLVIKAVNVGPGGSSPVTTAEFIFQVANPTISGNNAAQFTVSDITSNAVYWYTIDGSNPTNASPSIGPITSDTNSSPVTLALDGSTNVLFKVRAFRSGYQPSGIAVQSFSPGNFQANKITFGTTVGEPHSSFMARPGQFYYAPVVLQLLPGFGKMYSLQFNVTVTNGLVNTNTSRLPPAIQNGAGIDFFPMLMTQVKPSEGQYFPPMDGNWYLPIPPAIYLSTNSLGIPTLFTNNSINLLGVGWLYRSGIIYPPMSDINGVVFLDFDTTKQDLISYSIAHDTLFAKGGGTVVVGAYSFLVPTNASYGDKYFIQLGSPSATSDGVGAPGSSIDIAPPGASQAVTVSSPAYLVGDAAPFHWLNAGDFGDTNLDNSDVMQVYQSAILVNADGQGVNMPPTNSDLYLAMDSSGGFGAFDSANNYYTNSTVATPAQQQAMWDGNDFSINTNAFGDGTLNINDVYVTFRRSLDPSLVWFKRYWTNGIFVAVTNVNYAFNTNTPHLLLTKAASTVTPKAASQTSYQQSFVSFSAGDAIKSAGQTVQIPITANVFGNYPLRVLGLNLTVVPLDGSPAITQAVQFTPAAGLGQPTITASKYAANYNAAWLNSTISGLTGNTTIGTLTVTIPTTATSSSAYAIHFDHVSASPNGLAIFPKQTLTGLITLSSRTSSSYGDGIPDSWRLRWFGTINNLLSVSNACPTGDGINNWKKYVAGVDPNVANDFPSVNPKTPVPSGSTTAIHWPTVSGKQYAIERSASLFPGAWTAITTNTGTGTDMEFDDSPAGQTQFYRVRILP